MHPPRLQLRLQRRSSSSFVPFAACLACAVLEGGLLDSCWSVCRSRLRLLLLFLSRVDFRSFPGGLWCYILLFPPPPPQAISYVLPRSKRPASLILLLVDLGIHLFYCSRGFACRYKTGLVSRFRLEPALILILCPSKSTGPRLMRIYPRLNGVCWPCANLCLTLSTCPSTRLFTIPMPMTNTLHLISLQTPKLHPQTPNPLLKKTPRRRSPTR